MEDPFSTLTSEQIEFLKKLTKHSVDYIVIGGYAMKFHGQDRHTEDLDLLVSHDPKNAKKLLPIISPWYDDIKPDVMVERLTKPNIIIDNLPIDVDLLTLPNGVELKFNNLRKGVRSTNDLC